MNEETARAWMALIDEWLDLGAEEDRAAAKRCEELAREIEAEE